MNYIIREEEEKFVIYETHQDEERKIRTCSNRLEAQAMVKQLGSGAGFQGWTPQYLTEDGPLRP